MSSTWFGADRLEMLGELMRAATPTASLQQQEGRTRLIACVEKMRRPSRAKPALACAFAAANAAAVLVVLRVRERAGDGTPIAWHVEDGTASARGYVSVPLTAPTARLVFGDGSDVALAPGSRGRVAGTTSVGAKVVLEQGRARVHVQHREHARWLVDAGPFALRVNGTELLVAWSADAETLDVWTRSGRVEVTGPVLVDALSLSAGQHVRARLRDGTLRIDGEAEPTEPSALVLPGVGPDPASAKDSFLVSLPPSRDLGSEPCAVR
jgi:ferric-dicitrate binding protein FerR (iron transport regulator)